MYPLMRWKCMNLCLSLGVNCKTTNNPAAVVVIRYRLRSHGLTGLLTQDGEQVQPYANSVTIEVELMITLARGCVVHAIVGTAEGTGNVKVHQTGQAKSKQRSSESEPSNNVSMA